MACTSNTCTPLWILYVYAEPTRLCSDGQPKKLAKSALIIQPSVPELSFPFEHVLTPLTSLQTRIRIRDGSPRQCSLSPLTCVRLFTRETHRGCHIAPSSGRHSHQFISVETHDWSDLLIEDVEEMLSRDLQRSVNDTLQIRT